TRDGARGAVGGARLREARGAGVGGRGALRVPADESGVPGEAARAPWVHVLAGVAGLRAAARTQPAVPGGAGAAPLAVPALDGTGLVRGPGDAAPSARSVRRGRGRDRVADRPVRRQPGLGPGPGGPAPVRLPGARAAGVRAA